MGHRVSSKRMPPLRGLTDTGSVCSVRSRENPHMRPRGAARGEKRLKPPPALASEFQRRSLDELGGAPTGCADSPLRRLREDLQQRQGTGRSTRSLACSRPNQISSRPCRLPLARKKRVACADSSISSRTVTRGPPLLIRWPLHVTS